MHSGIVIWLGFFLFDLMSEVNVQISDVLVQGKEQ